MAMGEEDLSLQKVTIQGPTLASLINRCSTSPGDIDGLLFGRVSLLSPSSLSDDTSATSQIPTVDNAAASPTLVATITSFFASSTTCSFFDSAGHRLDIPTLHRLLPPSSNTPSPVSLIGWFSSRRRSPLRPSLRESSVSLSLSSKSQFSFPVENDPLSSSFSPAIFLLLTTPYLEHVNPQTLIHTHEYRAYQFHSLTNLFEPKHFDVINIGPDFRGHYSSFSPNSEFPWLPCGVTGSPMKEDDKRGRGSDRLSHMKVVSKDQSQLDVYANGCEVGSLSKLMGSEAARYTSGLEGLYESMLSKLDSLSRLVESSSAKVLEQENYNMKLRYKVAGVE